MAFPAIRSLTQTSTDTDASSIVVTKPTGLTVGDLMVAWIAFYNGGADRGINTPAGWTFVTDSTASNRNTIVVFEKIADSSDVAAANFTFTYTGTVDKLYGVLFAVTGYATGQEITVFESDSETAPSAATVITYTTALTPLTTDSLLMSGWLISDSSVPTPLTLSTYTVTPSITLTEQAEQSLRDGGGGAAVLGIATGNYSGTTTITSRSVTVNQSVDFRRSSIILLINSPQNAITDVSHINITPTIESITTSQINTTVQVDRIDILPSINGMEVKNSSDGDIWTSTSKSNSTWTNLDKS